MYSFKKMLTKPCILFGDIFLGLDTVKNELVGYRYSILTLLYCVYGT